MKKKILGLVLAVIATASNAQQTSSRPVIADYDLDSTSDLACTSNPIQPTARIVTSGSSTTTSALTANTLPFTLATVGDIIQAVISGVPYGRVITAKADGDNITVSSAWNLGTVGTGYTLWKRNCAAIASNAGWINVAANKRTDVAIAIDQLVVSTGGVAVKVEALYDNENDSFATAHNVWPGELTSTTICGAGTFASGYCVYTTAGITARSVFTTDNTINPKALRVVMKLTGTDSDATPSTDNEKIRISLVEVK